VFLEPKISLPHKKDFSQKRTKIQTSLLQGQTATLFLYFFVTVSAPFSSLSRAALNNSLCDALNKKEKEPQFTLCGACFFSVSLFCTPTQLAE
jgi:hypothetical protein